MKKLFTRILGAAMVLAVSVPARAEIVEDYRCDFKKAIDRNDPAFAVASSWGHVVDSYTNYSGTVYYQSYTQSAYSGHDGCGKIDIGSELLNNSMSCKDMLVTPKVSGAVSLWCQSTLYSSAGSIRFYAMKKLEDGTYEQGDEYTACSSSSLPGYNTNQWVEIVFDAIDENAEYPYIGIHGHNARISDFKAEKADIEKQHKLSISGIRSNGPTSGIVCDENNMATISLDITVLNLGDYSYDGSEENLTVSISRSGEETALKTFDIGELAEGVSKTLTCLLDPMPFSETGSAPVFDVRENFTGSTAMSPSIAIREYKPVINFRVEGGYTNVADGYVLSFGKVSGPVTKGMTVNAQSGTAPAEITAIDCPEGFSTDWTLPVTLGTTGSTAINITFDPEGMEVGTRAGDIEFTITGGDVTKLSVEAVVLDPALIYIPFADNNEIPGEIVNGTGNAAWRIGYTGSGASRDNYLQPTSSYSAAELVLPKLTFSDEARLTVDVRRSGTSASLAFAYSDDRTNWVELPDATLTMNSNPGLTYDFQTFEIAGVPEGDFFLRLTGSEVYIDNIYGLPYASVAHDLAIADVDLPGAGMVNNEYSAGLTLRNFKVADEDADSYSVVLIADGNEYTAAESPVIPGSQGAVDIGISFTPHAAGDMPARVEVRFDDGTVYSTPEVTVAVAEERIDALHPIAPSNNASGSAYVLPFNTSSKVFTEQIYPAEFVNLPAGTAINGLSFRGNTTKDYATHIEAWIALSDKTEQGADKLPLLSVDDLVKVFDGDYTFTASTERDWFLTMPFSEPFIYDGESSIIVYLRAISDNSTVYTFNFEAYSTTDPTRYTRYARWKIDDDGSLTGWDNYYLGYAALNLVVESGVVAGRVMEGDVPVEGAVVTLRSDNVEYYGTADAEGAFSIDVLQTGRDYTAVAEADAFVGEDASVAFADGMSQTLDIAMLPTKADFFGGVYEAVVLPDVSEAPAGTYYVFEAVEGNVLVFRQLTSMADLSADVPYIVAPEADASADLSALTFGRVAGGTTVGGTAFQGTYASRALRDGEYLPSDLIAVEGDSPAAQSADAGKIARASGAYVSTDILNPVIALRGSVSGIENVAADAQGSGAVYTIDGRLARADGSVEGLPAGIYLVNGRKVAVK